MIQSHVMLEIDGKVYAAMVANTDKLPFRISEQTLVDHFEEYVPEGTKVEFPYFRPQATALVPWTPDVTRDEMLTSLHRLLKNATSDIIKLREHQDRLRAKIREIQSDKDWTPGTKRA